MEVFSIDPNTQGYFRDSDEQVRITDIMYQGLYHYTPVYPNYTFSSKGRFNYMSTANEIEFYSMLPIKRLFKTYFVEVRFRFTIDHYNKDSLSRAIVEFNSFCEESTYTINIKTLINGVILDRTD